MATKNEKLSRCVQTKSPLKKTRARKIVHEENAIKKLLASAVVSFRETFVAIRSVYFYT